MLFGAGAVLICRVAEPALLDGLELLPRWVLAAVALTCAALLAIDTVFTLISWRQLSRKLELLRIELADKVNDSLKEASDSLLEKVPEGAVDSAVGLKARSAGLNSWLAGMSDSAFEAVRGKVELPSFIAEGGRGLRLVARRARNIAQRAEDSLKEASDSLLEKVPEGAVDSAVGLKARSAGLNSWLAGMSDSAFEAVRGKVELPSFIAEGGRGLRLVARRARNIAQRAEASSPVKLKTVLTRRELRFFNAFPEIKLKSYEGVIRATNLKERARELFHRGGAWQGGAALVHRRGRAGPAIGRPPRPEYRPAGGGLIPREAQDRALPSGAAFLQGVLRDQAQVVRGRDPRHEPPGARTRAVPQEVGTYRAH